MKNQLFSSAPHLAIHLFFWFVLYKTQTNGTIRDGDSCQHLRGSDDHLLGGDRLSPGAVLRPSQSPVHRCVPGADLGDSAIDAPLQLLDGNNRVDVENLIEGSNVQNSHNMSKLSFL